MLRALTWEEYGRHDYLPRAIVDVTVSDLERYHRVRFEQDVDDLGEVWWLPIALGSGLLLLLSRHVGSPDEIVVWGPDDIDLAALAEELGLAAERVQGTIRP
jgi:hypothetical protein